MDTKLFYSAFLLSLLLLSCDAAALDIDGNARHSLEVLSESRDTEDEAVGYMWHISDMHWDPTYSENSTGLACNEESEDGSYGMYGDFLCDAPMILIQSAVQAMKDIHPDPDFLIWTGDDTPHIYNDTILYRDAVLNIIFNLSDILHGVFPDHTVYSALGNHDWHPKHQLAPGPDPLYEEISAKWSYWLDEEANVTFNQGGYYVMDGVNSGLKIVVLNTNLYYTNNKETPDMIDPANQMQWLDDLLTGIAKEDEDQKVMIVSHVPPGMFEKHADKYWYYPDYNDNFVRKILQKHSGVIGSVHMAHHHTDSFRVVYDNDENPVGSLFLGPAVTPWETTLPDVMGGAGNNPSVRLVKYNRTSGEVLDIEQYYLNLREANTNMTDSWEMLYKATEYYDIPDLTAESLDKLVEDFLSDDDLFSKYFLANGVAYDPEEEWTQQYRITHYCAITRLDYDDFVECKENLQPTPTTTTQRPDTGKASSIGGASALVFGCLLAMWVVICG